ncbi:MAG: hypothetical protein GXY87_06360 [Tissierellia bacterium]|nr:hypothetical protein [Tissierellia bacterium]
MLKLTGNSIAINPTKELVNTIKDDIELRDKTNIIVERKDIVYSLNADVQIIEV